MELPTDIWRVIYDKLEHCEDRRSLSTSCKGFSDFFDAADWEKTLTQNWERKLDVITCTFSNIRKKITDKGIHFSPYYTEYESHLSIMRVELQLCRYDWYTNKKDFEVSSNRNMHIIKMYNFPIDEINNLIKDMNRIADCVYKLHVSERVITD